MKSPGVYIIQNTVNNKVYIGASRNIYNRLCDHKVMLRGNYHHNQHLQAAFNDYGESYFIFDVLEFCSESLIFSQENYWCNMLCSHDRNYGYNNQPTSPNGKETVSKETKIKMSLSAEKRPVKVSTVYGDFHKTFSNLHECANEFKIFPSNVHRKMNNIYPKKALIDSTSSKYLFSDIDVSLSDVKAYWDDVFMKLSNCEGPYKLYTCFGTFIGTATSKQIVNILNVNQNVISTTVKRGTYLRTLKITK